MRRKRKWYQKAVKRHGTGWHKDDPAMIRRRKMLRAHKGNYLASGRALLALANVTKDRETKRAARADAKWFFAQHKRRKHG